MRIRLLYFYESKKLRYYPIKAVHSQKAWEPLLHIKLRKIGGRPERMLLATSWEGSTEVELKIRPQMLFVNFFFLNDLLWFFSRCLAIDLWHWSELKLKKIFPPHLYRCFCYTSPINGGLTFKEKTNIPLLSALYWGQSLFNFCNSSEFLLKYFSSNMS